MSTSSNLPSSRFTFWLVLCAMILLATNMRAPIVALGAIAPVVKEALNISEIQIGWLGAVPMLGFALGALISPAIGKRFGIENTLIAMIALLTTGMILRTVIPTWTGFLIGTLLLTLAIGFANTLAAPVIKQHTRVRLSRASNETSSYGGSLSDKGLGGIDSDTFGQGNHLF